eukprot:12915060-Prorocentrum_lima.AAC.1
MRHHGQFERAPSCSSKHVKCLQHLRQGVLATLPVAIPSLDSAACESGYSGHQSPSGKNFQWPKPCNLLSG